MYPLINDRRISMKANRRVSHGIALLMVGSIVVLPSCGLIDWVKEKFGGSSSSSDAAPMKVAKVDDGSAVLATLAGKPLITKNMLEAEKKKLIEANPQMEAMLALMDENQLNRNLVDGMASREIIRKYVADHKVQQSDKYKKDLEMAMNQVKDLLNTRYFMEDFKSDATNDEIAKFYNENKDSIPNLLLSRGGIASMGIPFASDQDARDFMAKVKEAKNNLTRAAQDAKLSDKVKNFNLVNAESIGIEPELRDKIVEVKTTPSLHKFKVGNEFWVVAATRKEDPKYRDLDSVKGEIKQLIEKDKTMKVVEEQVSRLKNEYRVEVNEAMFASPADNSRSVQAAAKADHKEEAIKAVKAAVAEKSEADKKAKATAAA